MFIDDVRLYAMPYDRDVGGNDRYGVAFSDSEVAIRVGILIDSGDSHNPADSVIDFVREVAWILAYEGRAVYELIAGELESETSTSPLFRLELLPYGPILKLGSRFIQWIPREHRRDGKRWVVIPSARIVRFDLPRFLGSPRSERRLVRRLAQLSSLTPEFLLRDPAQAAAMGYDFETHRRFREIAIAQATRKWSWPARWSWREDATEYFQMWRDFRFRRNLAVLRQQVIQELNDLIARTRLGEVTVQLIQPASVEDFDRALVKMQSGEWEFARAGRELGIR